MAQISDIKEKLLEEMEVVEVTSVTEDEIVFSSDVDLKENDKVAEI